MAPLEPNFKLNINTSETLKDSPVEVNGASSASPASAKPEGVRSDAKVKADAAFEDQCQSVAVGNITPLVTGTPCPSCGYCPSCGRGWNYNPQPFWYGSPWYTTGPTCTTSTPLGVPGSGTTNV